MRLEEKCLINYNIANYLERLEEIYKAFFLNSRLRIWYQLYIHNNGA
jgi:hypothetical protein